MRDAGLIREATKKPWDLPKPTGTVSGDKSWSKVLQEMRDEERY